MRTLAIGDIHGCLTAFDHLLLHSKFSSKDTLITLGDYVDRGPDSKGVIDRLIAMHVQGNLIALRGNHEMMMLGAHVGGRDNIRFWLHFGGVETLESYALSSDQATLEDVPETHWHFIKHTCIDWYETNSHIFVHAGLDPYLPMEQQRQELLLWKAIEANTHESHISGKYLICGHTEQRSGLPLLLGSDVCIDTWAYGEGWLTCLDVESGDFWQTNELGEERSGHLLDL